MPRWTDENRQACDVIPLLFVKVNAHIQLYTDFGSTSLHLFITKMWLIFNPIQLSLQPGFIDDSFNA